MAQSGPPANSRCVHSAGNSTDFAVGQSSFQATTDVIHSLRVNVAISFPTVTVSTDDIIPNWHETPAMTEENVVYDIPCIITARTMKGFTHYYYCSIYLVRTVQQTERPILNCIVCV